MMQTECAPSGGRPEAGQAGEGGTGSPSPDVGREEGLARLDTRWLDPATASHVALGHYIPLELATGRIVDSPSRTLSLRRDDGLGLFDIRLDPPSGALVSATLVLYERAVASEAVSLGEVRVRGAGTPVFGIEPGGPERPGVRPDVERAIVPLECHVHARGVEVIWDAAPVDELVIADEVSYYLAGGRWIGLAFTALEAADRAVLDTRLGSRR